jgi:hypothetical protein
LFGELPKIFDRNFAIGFFLPAAAFVGVSLGLVSGFGLSAKLPDGFQAVNLTSTTLSGLTALLGGVMLLVLNYEIYRILEGYGQYNPMKLLGGIEKRRFKNHVKQVEALNQKLRAYRSAGEDFPPELRSKRNVLMWRMAERFPSKESELLPTAMGNTIKAFEEYSRIMYGLDIIAGWSRLNAVIPKDYREMIDTAKAVTDFWLNLWLLGILIVVEYFGLVIHAGSWKIIWFPPAAILVAWIAKSRARAAAVDWGDLIKASVDSFIVELRKKLDFPAPADTDEERRLWQDFSRAMLYKDPKSLIDRVRTAEKTEPGEQHESLMR